MEERELDIKQLIDNNQIDLDRLSKLNINYKNQIAQLNKEKSNLIKQNEEQKFKIYKIHQINLIKNENNFINKKLLQKKNQIKLKEKILKIVMMHLTYGKFKKVNILTR